MSKLTWFYKYYIILQFCLGLTYAIDCSMDAILSSSEQKASIFLSGANSAAHLGLVYIFPLRRDTSSLKFAGGAWAPFLKQQLVIKPVFLSTFIQKQLIISYVD